MFSIFSDVDGEVSGMSSGEEFDLDEELLREGNHVTRQGKQYVNKIHLTFLLINRKQFLMIFFTTNTQGTRGRK